MPAPAVPAPPGLKVLDLRQVTMAELHAEAAATLERDPFEVLLPDPPGAIGGRCILCGGMDVFQHMLHKEWGCLVLSCPTK